MWLFFLQKTNGNACPHWQRVERGKMEKLTSENVKELLEQLVQFLSEQGNLIVEKNLKGKQNDN